MPELPTPPPVVAAAQPNGSVAVRAERAAERVGIQQAEVERLPFDLSVLEDEGLFVNVDARGFGLLDRRLDWQALGISLPRNTDLAFRPPRCGLLPDRYRLPLLRPAARAHAALHRYSYRFRLTETLFETPSYRWVPWRAFEAFEREFQAAQGALEAARAAVLEGYDAVREEVVETILRLAADSARRLEATGHAIPEGFQDGVVRGVLAAMPSPEDLRDRLALRYRVGVLLLGSEMLAEQRRAREERRELEAAEAALRLEQRRREAGERLVQEQLWAEEERLRRRLQAEEDERRREAAVKERLRQLRLDAARERLQEAMSPLEEGARQLHAAVYDAASAIRASLQRHGHLHGTSARKARELARWFRLMSWQSDAELETLLGELEGLASRLAGKKKRDPGPLDQVLGDIVELCYADARALAEPHRMGALEL
ncbi:MAG TPA: hypothetical protein VFE37_08195 [Chloroflexota bacterium]|nr:hypothetical protein [Chloroflexota bacterium]